jgi:hypothetical protein
MKNKILLQTKHALLLSLFLVLLSAFSMATQAQVLSIDKLDYAPGETVYISGTGWTAGEEVFLQVFNETFPELNLTNHYLYWSVFADDNGDFSSVWDVTEEELSTSLILTADGQTSGFKYRLFFTDAADVSDGDGNMTVSPLSTCSGSSGNDFTFIFTNNINNKDFKSGALIKVTIPSGWTSPTLSNIDFSPGAPTDLTASISISGMEVTIQLTGNKNLTTNDYFTISYTGVTAPTTSGEFITQSKAKSNSGSFKDLKAGSPVITVNALPNNTSTG